MTNDCPAYSEGTVREYTSWAEAPTTDPYRPDCAPTCWELEDSTVNCMEPSAPVTVQPQPLQELAHTGPEDIDPMTAIAGAVMLIVGIVLTRKARRA